MEMCPRQGEFTLRESDIVDLIVKEGHSISLVIFSGVQYYTGQWFPMKAITTAAKAQVNFFNSHLLRLLLLRTFFHHPLMT
jgi:kynureninase